MRSRWPRGLRIHPANNPLLALPDSHPAKSTIIAHAECCRDCVGKEIEWPGREAEAFDQEWHSELIGRRFSFSTYAYAFLSFDLALEAWISHPNHISDAELSLLLALPYQETLLDECEAAATSASNKRVIERLPQIRRFNELSELAVSQRLIEDGIDAPQLPQSGDPLEMLGLHHS